MSKPPSPRNTAAQGGRGAAESGLSAAPSGFIEVDSGHPEGSLEDMKLRFTRRVIFLARRWRNSINDGLREVGQSHARWITLTWVSLLEGKANHRELAERVGVELPTLIRLLNRLEAEGLVERSALDTHSRAKGVRLTPAGKTVLAELTRISRRVRADFLEGVDEHQLAVSMDLLDQLLARSEGLAPPGE